MGLLDFNMPDMNSPEGQGLLATAFSLMQAKKMPGQRGAFAGALGEAGQAGMQTLNSSRDALQRRKYLDAQMEAQQMQLEAQRRAEQQRVADDAAVRGSIQNGNFDPRAFLQNNPAASLGGLEQGMKFNSALNPAPKYTAYKPGDVIFKDGDMSKPAFAVPDKPEAMPSAVREYQFAQSQGYQGTFDQWNKDTKKAGATQIGMPKIDIKMGDSVAGQVGPMLKDSRIAVTGAVKMYDAADRIEKALASNQVSAGPLSSQIQTVKQLIQKIGGGNDESIRQTQQVIRSLAQMSVEARKQLQGQGQVTESEGKAVAKADAGDIDNMTVGELNDLVTLTKRAAHFTAKGHQEMLDTMNANDGTRGAAPFYRVQGMETLLKHSPKLPQIGGGGDVRSQADAILKGK